MILIEVLRKEIVPSQSNEYRMALHTQQIHKKSQDPLLGTHILAYHALSFAWVAFHDCHKDPVKHNDGIHVSFRPLHDEQHLQFRSIRSDSFIPRTATLTWNPFWWIIKWGKSVARNMQILSSHWLPTAIAWKESFPCRQLRWYD